MSTPLSTAASPLTCQVDEPALREGLPLKKAKWDAYLGWAVDAFRYTRTQAGCRSTQAECVREGGCGGGAAAAHEGQGGERGREPTVSCHQAWGCVALA